MATWNSNGTPANIQTIHDTQASDGDTITVPAGTFIWTTGITLTKGITLQGAGSANSIIRDNLPSGAFLTWTLAAGQLNRLTGLKFQDGGRPSTMIGLMSIRGSNTDGSIFRMDNCATDSLNGVPLFNTVIGVIDHNTFFLGVVGPALELRADYWNGLDWGDGSWHAPINWGGADWLFIEDNVFTHNQSGLHAITDAYAGARFVVRYNDLFNSEISNHGTESTGRVRGCLAIDAYNNRWTGTNVTSYIGGLRSGVCLLHDNTNVSGYQGYNQFTLVNFRSFHDFNPWGWGADLHTPGADGTNPWDANDPTPHFTGTSAGNSGYPTVTVAGDPGWTDNQWVGYTIRRPTNLGGSTSLKFSWITGNTHNTLTYYGGGIFPGEINLDFATGDTVEIRKVNHALDQCGVSGGGIIGDDFTPTMPAGWNDQVVEKCYSWNNRASNGDHINFNVFGIQPGIRAGEHYLDDTVKPGYTSYVYPHPLVSGSPPPLSAPTFAPTGGAYSPFPLDVTITVPFPPSGVQISYTVDGSDPTSTHGTIINAASGTISLSTPGTLKAISFTGSEVSSITTAVYTLATTPGLPVPTFTPPPGEFDTFPLNVQIDAS